MTKEEIERLAKLLSEWEIHAINIRLVLNQMDNTKRRMEELVANSVKEGVREEVKEEKTQELEKENNS